MGFGSNSLIRPFKFRFKFGVLLTNQVPNVFLAEAPTIGLLGLPPD